MCDARSTLSCDSCSSDESSETEDETDLVTDTAVPGTYIHRESLNPASLDHDGLHITLELDKLGLKKTTRLVSPFLRVSVRGEQVSVCLSQCTVRLHSGVSATVSLPYLHLPSTYPYLHMLLSSLYYTVLSSFSLYTCIIACHLCLF